MKKLNLIKISIEKEIVHLLGLRIEKMLQKYELIKKSVHAELYEKLENIIQGRQGCVMISFLKSSYITGSNKFKIAFYEQELFVEEEPAAFLYSMEPYLAGIEEDVNSLWKIADKRFVQVFAWRKEELRRYYMGKVYEKSVVIFQDIVKHIPIKEEVKVFYGEEMGDVELIGISGSERS